MEALYLLLGIVFGIVLFQSILWINKPRTPKATPVVFQRPVYPAPESEWAGSEYYEESQYYGEDGEDDNGISFENSDDDDYDRRCLIRNLKAGQKGYTLPWAMDIHKGAGYINTSYPVTHQISGTSRMPIECTGPGRYTVTPLLGRHKDTMGTYPNSWCDTRVVLREAKADDWFGSEIDD